MPTERQFTLPGGRQLAARCWHDSQLPPVLALHGWLDNAATFDLLAPLLADYHVVALDFAGHGHSDHRAPGTRYHLLDHVDDVLAVLDQLGWSQCYLLGHSMGAGVAALCAAALPERVPALVMIDGLGPYTGEPAQLVADMRAAVLEWREFEHQVPSRLMASVEVAVRARMQGLLPVGEQAARLLCARALRAEGEGWVWRTDRRLRLRSPLYFSEQQVCAVLAGIQVPVLLILAEQGLPFHQRPEAYAARLAALQTARIEYLPGGHHLHLDGDVPSLALRIREFWSAQAASSPS